MNPMEKVTKIAFERRLIDRILRYLGLPTDQFFLNGSGALALNGVHRDRPMGDLDIFTTTDLWFQIFDDWPIYGVRNMPVSKLEKGRFTLVTPPPNDPKRRCDPPILRTVFEGLTVDVFLNWRKRGGHGDFDPALYLSNVEFKEGWPCAPLQFIMDWKLGQGRNKDLLDVVEIRRFMGIDGTIMD